jgi:hypothetical protein
VVICYIFPNLVYLDQEKSGNPVLCSKIMFFRKYHKTHWLLVAILVFTALSVELAIVGLAPGTYRVNLLKQFTLLFFHVKGVLI